MIELINLITDSVFKTALIAALTTSIYIMYKLSSIQSEEHEKRIKELEERLKESKDRINELKERIKELNESHKEELMKYSKLSKMYIELMKAVNEGVINLKCSKHNASVEVLADGTIICERGHRVWPPE